MKKKTKKRVKPEKKAGKTGFPTESEVDVFASLTCCGCGDYEDPCQDYDPNEEHCLEYGECPDVCPPEEPS